MNQNCATVDPIKRSCLSPLFFQGVSEYVKYYSISFTLFQLFPFLGLTWSDRPALYLPLALTSLLCTGLYTVSWQFDPCCQYQVSSDPHSLSAHPLSSSLTRSPVVLVRRDNYRRKLLHSVVTLASTALSTWKFYLTCFKWSWPKFWIWRLHVEL